MNTTIHLDSPTAAVSHRDLWHLTVGQRQRYAAAVLAMALTNVCMFAAPIIGGHAIDVLTQNDFTEGQALLRDITTWLTGELTFTGYLWIAALASFVATAVGGVFLYLRGRLAAQASESIARRLRENLYARLHHVQSGFYDTADTGDLVQRCSSDVETLRVFLVSDVIEIGRAIMLVICVVPVLFAIHVELAIWSLVMMPFLVVGAYVFFQKVKSVFQLTDESEGAMTAALQENLTGIRVVRAFARQQHEVDKFAEKNAAFREHNNRLIQLMGYYWSISDFFCMTQLGIVLLAGGYFAMQGSLSIGELFIFMTCQSIVIWPVRQLGRVLTDTGKAVISLGRVKHVLDTEAEAEQWTPPDGRARGEIHARGLSMHYPGSVDQPVLKDLDINIAAGETLAIVGPPGAGKTSLIRALLRLYPYQQGNLTLDGHEISGLDRFWLRGQIGVVLQDPFLYSRSIQDNLLVGRPQAPQQDIEAACAEAAVLDAINGFNDGFAEMVGERGVTLSGGQRQRLALARALLKDPPVLVLDDSLSAVDTHTEQLILQALRQRKGRQTTLIIAHRLSSVMHADRIMVLEQGHCVQLGSHAQLANVEGPYRRLCNIQGALDAQIAAELQPRSGSQPDVR
ncbi:MAG: ABC transporter ATP-binding protein [Pseudomonadota bacterium]